MTAITAFLRKTPITRLKDYFTAGGFTSLPPIDWAKPEPEVVEPLVKAVDGMSDDEKQRVILDAGRVAALADEPGQNALQNVVQTPGDCISVTNHTRNIFVSVADVLRAPSKFAISPQVLGARIFPGQRQRRFPIDHSEDCGIVWFHDKEYRFRGLKHRQILSMLFEAYWAGRRKLRTSDVLQGGDHVHRDTKVTTLGRAFSGRSDWRDFIREAGGYCWIEV